MIYDGIVSAKYWLDALKGGVEKVWGQHPIYGKPERIEELCFYRMLTAFYDSGIGDIMLRRLLLYYFLSGVFATSKPEDLLNKHAKTLPVDSFVPKIVHNLAIAYNDAPSRAWQVNGVEDASSARYAALYDQGGINGRLQIAYRYAKLCSGVLVRPYVGPRGRMQVEVLTPDLCRFRPHAQFPDMLLEVCKPMTWRDANGKDQTIFEVWTADLLRYQDAKGNFIDYQADGGEPIPAEGIPNPYGRIPYEVLRLVEPNNNDTFGGGLWPIVEGNIAYNFLNWSSRCSAGYESWGHWVGVNLGLQSSEADVTMGFGRGTFVDNVSGGSAGELAEPNLANVSGNGQYDRLDQYAEHYSERLLRQIGIPDSIISAQSGTPPSGIARRLERLELSEQRKADTLMLGPFEAAFSALFARVYNIDVAGKGVRGAQVLREDAECVTTFADEPYYADPDVEFATNVKQLLGGVITPTHFARLQMQRTFATDEEAVTAIAESQALTDRIRSVLLEIVAGKAPAMPSAAGGTLPTTTAPNITPQAPTITNVPAWAPGTNGAAAVAAGL